MDPFIPTLCRTEVTPDQRYVRVTFERDVGAHFELLVPVSQFPSIATSIQTQADQLAPGTAKRSLLRDGQSLSVDGFRLLPGTMEQLILTVFARIFDADGERGVSIQVPLSPESAQTLREKLNRHLSSDDPEKYRS